MCGNRQLCGKLREKDPRSRGFQKSNSLRGDHPEAYPLEISRAIYASGFKLRPLLEQLNPLKPVRSRDLEGYQSRLTGNDRVGLFWERVARALPYPEND